ncbi:MAG: Ig-like domain-containing protein [Akkermansiaceae bacterium]|nr:Ig-like domain-containing protein [Akkermansiaceae bacterium]
MKKTQSITPVAVLVGLALASLPARGQVTFTKVTSDADSGINSAHTYTHAIDFGSGTKATVNGVPFVADFGTAAGGIPNSGSRTYGPSPHGGNAPPAVSGGVAEIFRDMHYNGPDNGYVELTGLTPGKLYEFRLYDRAWDFGGTVRTVTLSFDINGDGVDFTAPQYDQNRAADAPVSLGGNVSWVTSYTYKAGSNGKLKVIFDINPAATYHLYGLTNMDAGPDETPPVVETLSPPDDETPAVGARVYPGANLVATFDEDIALTGAGTITITDEDDGSSTVNIDLSSLPDPDAAVSVSGAVLTVDPAVHLEFGTNYSVRISAGAIKDMAETPNAFPGIANSTTWNFVTAAVDGTPPVLAAVAPFGPADGTVGVLPDTKLTVTFDENILVNPSATRVLLDEGFESGGGGFTMVDHSGGAGSVWARGAPASSGSGGSVTTGNGGSANCWGTNIGNPGIYASGTDTSLISPVIDLTGVPKAVLSFAQAIDILAGDTLVVNVIDDTTDTILQAAVHTSSPDPNVNAANWEKVDSVVIAGGQPVRIEWRFDGDNDGTYLGAYIDDVRVTGVGSSDLITLKDLTNMSDTVIRIDDSSQVSVSGSVLTIKPATPLAAEADYAVQIGSTAIRNFNELNFAGIADTTTWNFTTIGPRTLTWDPVGGGASDGAGTWLATGKWWNGTANLDWGNSIPDNAVIGNGGAGGSITMGAVRAGTVVIDNFTGTYTFASGGSLDQSGGITIGPNAGHVNLSSAISGTGGLVINAPVRVNIMGDAKTFSGDIVISGGAEMIEYAMNMGTGNISMNNGVFVDYWGGNFTRTLGTGAGEVQLPGGESGFCGQGRNGFNVRLNNSTGYEVVWGAPGEGAATGFFNPSKLILQSPWANFDGKMNFQNPVDLNGATRTVKVNKDHGAADGYAIMSGVIRNSDAGKPAGLVKEGPGRLILTAANTYNGGTTMTGGTLSINSPGSLADASMTVSGGKVNGSGTLTFNIDGTTADQIVMSGGELVATGLTVNINPAGPGLTQAAYVLVDATGGGTISGTFAGLTGASGYTLDYGTPKQVKLVRSGGDPYDSWIGTFFPGVTDPNITGKDKDPDGDGKSNLHEFAFNGDPKDPSKSGLLAGLVQDASMPAGKELTLVVAVRAGATFTGSGTPVVQSNTTAVDGLTYTIEGSLDLVTIPGSDVSHVAGPSATAPAAAGLPDLTGTGWEYHTFKLNASEGLGGKGFLRTKVE